VCTPVEDDPRVIGSGPTVADDTSAAEAIDVLRRHALVERVPAAVVRVLEGAAAREAARSPHDARRPQAAYWVIASRQDAMRGAAETARRLGYHTAVHAAPVTGAARTAARPLLDEIAQLERPACLIASGETVVHVRGAGRGGRNQELAVGAWGDLPALAPAALIAIGTDGRDGPTDAAGAYVDEVSWTDLGQDAPARCAAALEDNDVYPLLDRAGALLRTGPTGTNVGDLCVIVTR
jgi:glycerate 2-kinase